MGVDIDNQHLDMTTLNGCPGHYENIITTANALGDISSLLIIAISRIRLLRGEKWSKDMHFHNDEMESSLFNSISKLWNIPAKCSFYKRRGHRHDLCCDKYTSLNPKQPLNRGNDAKNVWSLLNQKWRLVQARITKSVCLNGAILSVVKDISR